MKSSRLSVPILLVAAVLSLWVYTVASPAARAIAAANATPQAIATATPIVVAPATATPTSEAPASLVRAAGLSDLQDTLQRIYESANPSVVNVWGISPPDISQDEITEESLFPEFSMPLGSGFIWDKEGHIITNNHVINQARQITVSFSDGLTVPAIVVGQDAESDLAVLKVDPAEVAPRELLPITVADSTQVKVGQFAIVIGNPLGYYEGTMTFGIVSAVGRTLEDWDPNTAVHGIAYAIPDVIQTDAPINPGNSGGVLLDLQGHMIGVPAATGDLGSEDISLAIPSVIVSHVVPAIIENGFYEHPWLGIYTLTLTPDLAQAMGLPKSQRGALVFDISVDSPADAAGVRGSSKRTEINGLTQRVGGDLITAIGGYPVTRAGDIDIYLVRHTSVGQSIKLTLVRDGKEMALELTVAARPSSRTQEAQPPVESAGAAWLGINGVTLTPELTLVTKLKADQEGVLIQSVVAGSPADLAGLQGGFKAYAVEGEWVMIGGDIITAVDGAAVTSLEDLAGILQAAAPGQKVVLTVLRGGAELNVSVVLSTPPAQTM